jgi:hypothetical protein
MKFALCLLLLVLAAPIQAQEIPELYQYRWLLAIQAPEDEQGAQEIVFIVLFFGEKVLMRVTIENYLSGHIAKRDITETYYPYTIEDMVITIDGDLELIYGDGGLMWYIEDADQTYFFKPVAIQMNFQNMEGA